jgi:O-antigen/teichoic acid export membrane protein
VLVIQNRLINSNEILGNLGMAGNFSYAYSVLLTLTGNAMPAMSEAFSNGCRKLSQYYSAMTYKYGAFISAFLASILLAVADRFILGSSGKEFERAALYAAPLVLSGALQFASWTSDIVMYAANKTLLVTLFAAVSFVVNFGVAFALVDRFQVNAILITGFVGLIVKDILAYFLNDRFCFKQSFYAWQSLIAPTLAGAVHFLWLRWVTGLIWEGDEITSMVIFLIALLPSYPVFSFLYGLFGGWDDATLAEFGQGAELSSFMRPMTRLFYRASVLGARLSPLHNRFPISIRPEAMAEAEALTQERVSLVQAAG